MAGYFFRAFWAPFWRFFIPLDLGLPAELCRFSPMFVLFNALERKRNSIVQIRVSRVTPLTQPGQKLWELLSMASASRAQRQGECRLLKLLGVSSLIGSEIVSSTASKEEESFRKAAEFVLLHSKHEGNLQEEALMEPARDNFKERVWICRSQKNPSISYPKTFLVTSCWDDAWS